MSREYYKITIHKITDTEVEELTTKYHHKDGRILNWSGWYSLPEGEREQFETVEYPTGKIKVDSVSSEVYSQKVDTLDLGELAIFINQAR